MRPVELAPADAVASRSRAERSKLRRELGRLDAVCLLIAAIVVLDTLGAVARGGAQTLTCWCSWRLRRGAGKGLRDPARDVPASSVRAGALTCALYAVPVLAICWSSRPTGSPG